MVAYSYLTPRTAMLCLRRCTHRIKLSPIVVSVSSRTGPETTFRSYSHWRKLPNRQCREEICCTRLTRLRNSKLRRILLTIPAAPPGTKKYTASSVGNTVASLKPRTSSLHTYCISAKCLTEVIIQLTRDLTEHRKLVVCSWAKTLPTTT